MMHNARLRNIEFEGEVDVDVPSANPLVDRLRPLARATMRPGVDAVLGALGGVCDMRAAGYVDPLLVSGSGSVGTKLKIAIATGLHKSIGRDLVAACVNELVVQGAEPLFFMDYFSCGQLQLNIAERVVTGVAEGCKEAGCALIGGQTTEMPGIFETDEYDLAGFCVGAVERGGLLPSQDMVEGDVLIGLPSSGPHAAGFNTIRKLVVSSDISYRDPAPFDTNRSLGEALLAPGRIYARQAIAAIRETGAVRAVAHIAEGGLTECIPRILPPHLAARVELNNWGVPHLFQWLQMVGNIEPGELLRTFNCGIGMVFIVDKNRPLSVLRKLREMGEKPIIIGALVPRQMDLPLYYAGALTYQA